MIRMRANLADIQLILGVIGALWVVSVTSGDMCARYDVNGCSIPFRLPFFYKTRFTPACNRHDICYRCGYLNGISRNRCDEVFHGQMRGTCSQMNWVRRHLCRGFAKGYYKVVKRFGSRRYRVPSRWYCHQAWVPSCLPTINT